VGLLDTIIGIAERSWREKPRKDVVKAFVHLRDTMLRCQQRYNAYRDLPDAGGIEKLIAQIEWRNSVTDLSDALLELDEVLQIFSPEARAALETYGITEAESAEPEPTKNEEPDFDVAAQELKSPSDIDLEHNKLQSTFQAALEKLEVFIRDNFKIEEIYSLKKGHL
jgi:hypothetical protein